MKIPAFAGAVALIVGAGWAGAASAGAPAHCTTAQARYELMGAPGFTAGFVSQPKRQGWVTDVALFVRSATSGKAYWFLFDRGSARYVNMISTTDVTASGWNPPDPDGGVRPLGEMHYFAVDRSLSLSTDLPAAAAAAPDYVFLPDLAETLWHGQKDSFKEEAPTAFFKRVSCGV